MFCSILPPFLPESLSLSLRSLSPAKRSNKISLLFLTVSLSPFLAPSFPSHDHQPLSFPFPLPSLQSSAREAEAEVEGKGGEKTLFPLKKRKKGKETPLSPCTQGETLAVTPASLLLLLHLYDAKRRTSLTLALVVTHIHTATAASTRSLTGSRLALASKAPQSYFLLPQSITLSAEEERENHIQAAVSRISGFPVADPLLPPLPACPLLMKEVSLPSR